MYCNYLNTVQRTDITFDHHHGIKGELCGVKISGYTHVHSCTTCRNRQNIQMNSRLLPMIPLSTDHYEYLQNGFECSISCKLTLSR